MKNNYEDIKERIELIKKVSQKIQTSNKKGNILKELNIYKILVLEALESKKQVELVLNPKINELEDKINILIRYKKLDLSEKDIYEGLGIAKIIYHLEHVEVLEDFNADLKELIEVLNSVNIKISEKNFKYTKDVNKYMKVLFCELDNTDLKHFNFNMKQVFDGIHWENNDILEEIVLNVKKVLKEVEPCIKNYLAKTKTIYANKYNISTENIDDQILNCLKMERELRDTDKYLIDKKLREKTIDIHNFIGENKKINNAINEFVDASNYRNMSIDERNKFEDNVANLYINLIELKTFNRYKFLIDETKDILNTPTQKGFYEKSLKNYTKLTKERELLTVALEKLENNHDKVLLKKVKTLVGEKNRLEKISAIDEKIKYTKKEIKKTLKSIKEMEVELEKNKFEFKIRSTITNTSSVYDIFKLFGDNNTTFIKYLKKYNKHNSIDDLDRDVREFKKFISDPRINQLKSINLNNSSNIKEIIEKNYNLKINLDMVENFNNVYENAKLIYEFKNLKRSKINLTELKKYL